VRLLRLETSACPPKDKQERTISVEFRKLVGDCWDTAGLGLLVMTLPRLLGKGCGAETVLGVCLKGRKE